MGSNDRRFPEDGEGPVRSVTVSTFAMACHAVSNLQFGDFVRATGFMTDAERYGWSFVFAGFLSEENKRAIGSRACRNAMVGSGAACLLGAAGRPAEHNPRPSRSPGGTCLLERCQSLLPMVGYTIADGSRMGNGRSRRFGRRQSIRGAMN